MQRLGRNACSPLLSRSMGSSAAACTSGARAAMASRVASSVTGGERGVVMSSAGRLLQRPPG